MNKISVVILTKNEEKHIRGCLESVKWADEIIILDSFSADHTVEIAREFTDKIYQRDFTGFPQQRHDALQFTSNSWVFMVDSDMVIPRELREEIKDTFSRSIGEYSAFKFRFLTVYFGKEIRHCGWYDPNNTRLFNKEKGNFNTSLRYLDDFIPKGKVGVMKNHILHFGQENISEYVIRLERYSTLNAEDLMSKGYRISYFNIYFYFLIKPMMVFLYKFIYKRGFLDGVGGLMVCITSAITYCISYLKLWEKQKKHV